MSYIFIGLVIVFLAYLGSRQKVYRWLLFAFMTIILGYRCNVGTDYSSYTEYFNNEIYYLEPGFNILCSLIKQASGDAYDMFYIIAFISLFLITLALNRKEIHYFPTAVLCYIFTFPFLANGIRQGVAISIFFYAYKFIEEKKLLKYMCSVGIAALFHYSILIVLPLYFIVNRTYRKYAYIITYSLSLASAFAGVDFLLGLIEQYISFNRRYGAFFDDGSSALGGYLSFGIIFQLILYLFILCLSLKCKIHEKYPTIFNLFFIATILYNLRISSYLFNRVEIIFSWFQFIVIPIIINSHQVIRYRQIIIITLFFMYLAIAIQGYYLDSHNCLYPYVNILTKNIF